MTQQIQVPYQGFRAGEPFESLELDGVEKALRECQDKGYKALTMPALADTKIAAPNDSYVWRNRFITTLSLRATGRGKVTNVSKKGGTPFVVFYHLPDHHFSDPDNIAEAVSKGLLKGAGVVPQEEFQRYLDRKDDELVFVENYEEDRNSSSGGIALSTALKNPQTVPFFGSKNTAEKYLVRHREVVQENFSTRRIIGVWNWDDLDVQPRGRLLALGYYIHDKRIVGSNLNNNGRFVGVRVGGAAGTHAENKQVTAPSLEEVLALADAHVSKAGSKAFKKSVKGLYSKRSKK